MSLFLFVAKWSWASVFLMMWALIVGFSWKEPLVPLVLAGIFLLLAVSSSYLYLTEWISYRNLWRKRTEEETKWAEKH